MVRAYVGFLPGGRARNVYKSTTGKTQRAHYKKATDAAGVILQPGQATHARRHHALKRLARDASREQKARFGSWTAGQGRMERHYEDPLEWSIMAKAAGLPGSHAGLNASRRL